MSAQKNGQLVIKDSDAIIVWIAGGIFTMWGIIDLIFFPSKMLIFEIMNPVLVISGLVILLFYANLTIIADRPTRSLRLEYRYLLFHGVRVIPFDDIENIHSGKSSSSSHGHTRTGYRIVATLKNGRNIPFRSSFGGADPHWATRLQAFIDYKTAAERRSAVAQIPSQAGSSIQSDEMDETNESPSSGETESGSISEQGLPNQGSK